MLTADGNKWIYKHKNYGMLSATASLGMILLWDVDGGLSEIDKLLYTNEDYIKVLTGSQYDAGAYVASVASSLVHNMLELT